MTLRIPIEKLGVYRVHPMHHRSLYLDHLPHAIQEKYKDAEGLTALERELFIDTSIAWELGEIEMVGYVGLYHLWERHSTELVSIALGQKRRAWPKTPAARAYPEIVVTHLTTLGISLSTKVLDVIREANSVVNAYKHGDDALERLAKARPEYFVDTALSETFHIPPGKLVRFFDAIDAFWSEIEGQVEPTFPLSSNRRQPS